jgi:hypothetical protein
MPSSSSSVRLRIGSESIGRALGGEVVTQDADDAAVTLLSHHSSASATYDLVLVLVLVLVHVGEDEEACLWFSVVFNK